MFIEVTNERTGAKLSLRTDNIEAFCQFNDHCEMLVKDTDKTIPVIVVESYDEVKALIAAAHTTVSCEPSDADKICEALDEVTAELRNVREAIRYR